MIPSSWLYSMRNVTPVRRYMGVLIAQIVFVVFWLLCVRPWQQSALFQAMQQRQQQELSHHDMTRMAQEIAALTSEKETALQVIASAMQTKTINQRIQQLMHDITRHKLTFDKINLYDARSYGWYSSVPVRIHMYGTLADIQAFLRRIHERSKLLAVVDVQIQKAHADQYQFVMHAELQTPEKESPPTFKKS